MSERRDTTADASGERDGERSRSRGEAERAARRGREVARERDAGRAGGETPRAQASRPGRSGAGDGHDVGGSRARGREEVPADVLEGSPSQSDAAMSTIREAPGAAGSTTRGRVSPAWAAEAASARRARRWPLARMLGAMVFGTCATVYVASRMSQGAGETRGASGASVAVAEGAAGEAAVDGGAATGARGATDGGAATGARAAEGDATSGAATGARAVDDDAASGAATGARAADGEAASGAAMAARAADDDAASGGAAAGGGAGGSASASAGEGGAPAGQDSAAPGESLWVAVAKADGEAAERRRRIAAQVRALTSEPRILACLLGHVPMGVGRRTELTGSVVVAGDGEVVRASIRAGAVPAAARACVAAELEKTRFAAGPQAQLSVPLRLEIL